MPNDTNAKFDLNEQYDIPIDVSDLLTLCKRFSQLGWKIQSQVEYVVENGLEEALESGVITADSLPHIRSFLKLICENVYFGDAADQCLDVLTKLDDFAAFYPHIFKSPDSN